MTHDTNDHGASTTPPTADVLAAMHAVAAQLQALADESPRARLLIRSMGQALLAIAAAADAHATDAVNEQASPDLDAAHAADAAYHEITADADENGSAASAAPAFVQRDTPPAYHPRRLIDQVTDDDLAPIMERCQIKAEAARWTVERARLAEAGADFFTMIEPRDRELIERARMLDDCYLWMLERNTIADEDIELYEQLGGCFANVAAAVNFLREALAPVGDEQPPLEQALLLAAEAQSALRAAASMLQASSDRDQLRLFYWLRVRSTDEGIFIQRFMRVADTADPSEWRGLHARIEQASACLKDSRFHRRRERKLFNKARYHLKLIHDNPHLDTQRDWQKVIDTVDELVEGGTPPSSRDIRDLLLPVIDDIPGAVIIPKHVRRVFNDIDEYLASTPSNVPVATAPAMSDDVIGARELLRGQAVVLIGGVRRVDAAEQISAALGLSDLIWIETREHQTHTVFEPYVARPDVALVLLAIRWSSHGFSEVQTFCERYGKPLVRLPGGYNPNQVAYQIMSQVSQQLGSAPPASDSSA